MSTDYVIAILAGGAGTRLWPLSSEDRPKQFLRLFSGRSMLQRTFDRAAAAVGSESVFVIGSVRHEAMYREQLPDLNRENLILEPAGRGTAAAVALACIVCSDMAPDATIATIPSDHLIPDPDEWAGAVRAGLAFARANDSIVCLGTTPRPRETKFGYLVAGETIGGSSRYPVKRVERFIEKPSADTLESLMAGGGCVRNMGTLMFQPEVLTGEMKRFVPDMIDSISNALEGDYDQLARAYEKLPMRSVDEAVLQRSRSTVVLLGDITSTDAGDFVTLGDAIGRDKDGSAVVGRVVAVDARDNTVFAENVTVALVGVSDIVVVVEGGRILVSHSGETQRIKRIQENT